MTTHEDQLDDTATSVNEEARHAADPSDSSQSPEVPPDAAPEVASDAAPEVASEPAAEPVHEPAMPEPAHEPSTDEMLFAGDDLAELRTRWAGVQAAFVDDPKDCVQKADVLVSDLVEQLTSGFAQARSRLEEQWSRGNEASTEDLRLALMHYREFFERLLAV
jgi:hypothetical protein